MEIDIERRRTRAYLITDFSASVVVGVPTIAVQCLIIDAIDIPTQFVTRPLQCVHMETARGIFYRCGRTHRLLSERPRKPVVRRAIRPFAVGISVDDFHNIQLAAGGPCAVGRVRGHHPERTPQSLPGSGLNARFDTAVRKLELLVSADSTRGVSIALNGLLAGANGQVAVSDGQVVAGIPLEFIIAPAGDALCGAISLLNIPVGQVEGVAVEFITPHQIPFFLGCRIKWW